MTDSNKVATPATDDEVRQISWNLRGKPEDGYDLPNIYVFSLIARIESEKRLREVADSLSIELKGIMESDRLALAEKDTEITTWKQAAEAVKTMQLFVDRIDTFMEQMDASGARWWTQAHDGLLRQMSDLVNQTATVLEGYIRKVSPNWEREKEST